jgi:hypothetical protein
MINTLLPQCGSCRRFRAPSGEWVSNVLLAQLASEADTFPYQITTGLCDDCKMEDAVLRDLSKPNAFTHE